MTSLEDMGRTPPECKTAPRRRFLRGALAALALWVVAGAGAPHPAQADDAATRTWLIAFEVLPHTDRRLPGLLRATYEQKAAVTQEAAERIVPKILPLVGGGLRLEWVRIGPGGHAGEINPAIYASVVATRQRAEQVAAALGYVVHQSHVLVADLQDAKGNVAMVEITFDTVGLTPLRAASFLKAANLMLSSNEIGFSALDDSMVFLNIGTGIDDQAFHAGLARTAIGFPPPPGVSALKRATALFVSNNWATFPEGEAFADRLGGIMSNAVLNLRQLRGEHRALVGRAAKRFSWH